MATNRIGSGETPAPAPRTGDRQIRRLRRAGVAVLLLAVAGAAGWLVLSLVARDRLAAEVEAIRERGEPLDLAKLAAAPLDPEDNGAIPMIEAKAAFVASNRAEYPALVRFAGDPFGAAAVDVEGARRFLAANAATLAHLDRALARPGFRYGADLAPASDAPGADVVFTMEASRVIQVRALLAARDGDPDAAWAGARAVLDAARAVGPGPTLLATMGRVAIRGRGLDTIRRLLARGSPPDGAAAAIVADLDGVRVRDELRRSVLGERAFGHAAFRRVRSGTPLSSVLGPDGAEGGFTRRLRDAMPTAAVTLDHARYLRLLARAVDLAGRPHHEAAPGWTAFLRDVGDGPWYALLSEALVPNLPQLATRTEVHRAGLDLARIALAGEAEGPAAGSERGTIDPFTGRPYEATTDAEGRPALRSVGPDGRAGTPDDEVWPRR